MFKTTVSFCICAAMVLSAVNFLGTVPAGEQIIAAIPNSEHALGGLWNPEGPTESATTHIISPATILSDHPEPRPSAVDNSAGLPPVGNQQTQGSCTAWAIGYYHATYIENREHPFDLTDPANQISPAFLYNVANGGYNGGSFMEDVADLLISNGACSMADMPYNTADYTSWPSEDWMWVSGMKHRAISQNWLDLRDPHGMDALKAHLAAGNTATTGIDVWGNFDNIESYNYTYCSSEVTGSNRGGHIVAIIGYDDDKPTADGKGAFRMVNSWGTGWGEAGFWWMSYEAIVDGVLGYGQAMYLESAVDYTPKLVAKASIYHDARGDIVRNSGLELSIYQNESTLASKPFLSCYWIEYWYGTGIQNHPFPEGKMAFDISEFIPYMDPLADCEFDLMLYNQGTATGDLATFEILNSEWWEGCIGEGLPMTIEPSTDNYGFAFTVPNTFVHYPIRADGDLGLAHRAIGEMWEGDGTAGNPYLIHDYIINGTDWGNCIYVGNTSADFEISGCDVSNTTSLVWSDYCVDTGLFLYNVSGAFIDTNKIADNLFGIYLYMSSGVTLDGNRALANEYGFMVSGCNDVQVRGNTVESSTSIGISVDEGSSAVEIYHNNLLWNSIQASDDTGVNSWDDGYPSGGNYWSDYTGVDSFSGPGQDQLFSDGVGDTPYEFETEMDQYPLMLPWELSLGPVRNQNTGEYFDTIQGAIIDPETLNGHTITVDAGIYYEHVGITKRLTLKGHDQVDTIIDGGGVGTVVSVNAPWVNITGFTVRNSGNDYFIAGIGVSNSYCRIENNTLTDNTDGIGLWTGTGNYVANNKFSYNWDAGIFLDAGGQTVVGNTISNGNMGMFLYVTATNTIYGNSITHTGFGFRVLYSNNNLIQGNALARNENGIFASDSDGNEFSDNIISNDYEESIYGIHMWNSADSNIIHNNTIWNTNWNWPTGICIEGSNSNIITENRIICNETWVDSQGIHVSSSTNNMIYHNSLINNTEQAFDDTGLNSWHNGYPSGGNYWSDYAGPDLMSGPPQNMPGSDGIGDIPYMAIDGGMGAQDDYPLMEPWTPPLMVEFVINLTAGWNLISIPLGMAETSVEGVLSSVAGMWDSVKYYDTLDTLDPWKSYRPSGTANDLTAIDMTMGIWVHATANCTLSVQGEILPTTQITLYAGWNLVGYPSQTEMAVADALWGTGADRVEVFDPASPTLIMPVGPGYIMRPGEGYWVHVVADTVWTVDW